MEHPTKLYQDLCSHMRNPVVFLDWSTNAYHMIDLSLNLGQNTITNHYHRGEDRGIDLGVGGHAVGVATWATW